MTTFYHGPADDWDPQGYDNDVIEEELPEDIQIKDATEIGKELEEEDLLTHKGPDALIDPNDETLNRLKELEALEKEIDEPPLNLGTEEEI